MNRSLLATLTLLPLAACNSPGVADQPAGPTQRWVCGQEYENHAWGYQRTGMVLDGNGHVWRYEFKGSPTSLPHPWQPKNLSVLTEEELRVRYNGAVDTGRRVDLDDIARRIALIIDASGAKPTDGRHVGADMGAHTLYCLARNVPHATYRQVLIDQKGDIESTNPSPAAKELAVWLAGVFK